MVVDDLYIVIAVDKPCRAHADLLYFALEIADPDIIADAVRLVQKNAEAGYDVCYHILGAKGYGKGENPERRQDRPRVDAEIAQ